MPLPHNALVLVADGRKMLFFRNNGDEAHIDLRTEAHEQRDDTMDRGTDAPGTNFQSFNPKRSSYEETDIRQFEEDRWATRAAEMRSLQLIGGPTSMAWAVPCVTVTNRISPPPGNERHGCSSRLRMR